MEEQRVMRFWYGVEGRSLPTIDIELLNIITQLHEYKIKQENTLNRQSQQLEKLNKLAFNNSVTDSNKIEGITSTPERVKRLIDNTTTPQTPHEEEILGYIAALRHVSNIVHLGFFPQVADILHLHKILFQHSTLTTGGAFKVQDNSIVSVDAHGTMYEVFRPLAAAETQQALEDLLFTLNHELSKGEVDPLLLIPIFIHDFLCIHPFADGNGRMSRLLTELLLEKCGYHIGKYISIDSNIYNSLSSYYANLNASSEAWHEQRNNVQPFVKYLLKKILMAYYELDQKVGYDTKSKNSLETVREAVRLQFKFKKQDVYKALPHLSRSTIENMLYQLVAENYITRHGKGRATFYLRNLN